MGGIQTPNAGLPKLGTFRYVAVMSSGWISQDDRDFFYKSEAAKIPTYNKELRLFWWGWGETDIARANGLAVIDAFKSKGVKIETLETPGGHEWSNWRFYLHEIAPKLFREGGQQRLRRPNHTRSNPPKLDSIYKRRSKRYRGPRDATVPKSRREHMRLRAILVAGLLCVGAGTAMAQDAQAEKTILANERAATEA